MEGQRQGVWLRKLHDDLLDQGETICPNRVACLASLAGIKAQIGYKRRPGSHGGKPSLVLDNTLDRRFDVDAPDRIWGETANAIGSRERSNDITDIRTLEGFAHLAAHKPPRTFSSVQLTIPVSRA
jgi:putative transposase